MAGAILPIASSPICVRKSFADARTIIHLAINAFLSLHERQQIVLCRNAPPVKPAIVRIERLSKYFGTGAARVNALVDINMEVNPGQVVGLMGPSGSGKTTLLNCIACILRPSSGRGEMVYDDRWLKADLRRLRLDKIGFIFLYPDLLPFLDATDNVAVVLRLAGFSSGAALKRAVELLDYLEVGHRRHAMPAQLSGGEGQRVAIARALANRPRIILADEPTAPLDSARARIVMDLLRRIAAEQDAAIICVTTTK